MSALYSTVSIEDLKHENCTEQEVTDLLDIFERTIKYMATTLARKSEYHLKDFQTAKPKNLHNFTLTIERRSIHDTMFWFGHYECKKSMKEMDIVGVLEE